MSKLAKNTAYYTVGNIIPTAGQFILLPLYTSYLTLADYGITNSLAAFSALLSLLITLSIGRSIYRLYYDYNTDKEKRDFLGTINIGLFFITTTFILLLFLFNNITVLMFRSIQFYPYYVIILLTTYFGVFENIPKIYLVVKEKASIHLIISVAQFILNNIFILYFVVFCHEGAIGYLKGQLYGVASILPFFIYLSFKYSNFVFRKNMFNSALKFCLPMVPSQLAIWGMTLSNRIFIEHYHDMTSVGIFALGYRIASIGLVFSDAFKKAYDPFFYKIANTEIRVTAIKKLTASNNIYLWIILFVSASIALFSKDLIFLIFNSNYHPSFVVVPIITIAYFFDKMHGIQNLSFYQDKKTSFVMYLTIIMGILSVGLNFIFIPFWGELGAAWAMVTTSIIIFFIKYYFSKKVFYIPFYSSFLIQTLVVFYLPMVILDYLLKLNNLYLSFSIKLLIAFLIFIFSVRILKKKFPEINAIKLPTFFQYVLRQFKRNKNVK